jgi:urease accessory protein
MQMFRSIKLLPLNVALKSMALLAVVGSSLLLASPALAHHPFGEETPETVIQGFLSGLGHPVVGLDHLAFVIAAGLLAAVVGAGLSIPIGFVLASIAGTGLHLVGVNLPAAELFISGSVLLFGVLLALRNRPNIILAVTLAAIAGVFHGYAYGEAVIGAQMTPIMAYLLGFASVQMGIAAFSCWIAQSLGTKVRDGSLALRFAGFTLAGVGGAFLSGVILG